MASEGQKQYETLVMDCYRKKLVSHDDIKRAHDVSIESLGKTKEAILVGLTSQYDLDLFREAQAKACEDEVRCEMK